MDGGYGVISALEWLPGMNYVFLEEIVRSAGIRSIYSACTSNVLIVLIFKTAHILPPVASLGKFSTLLHFFLPKFRHDRYTTATFATRKILEYNNSEKFARQAGPPLVFDASQKGNWENVRNECFNGKPFRFSGDILEPPPSVSQQYGAI